MMTRRHFVSSLACVVSAGGLGLGLDILRRRQLAMSDIIPATVLPLQGARVTLQNPTGQRHSAVLTRVNAVRHPARPGAPGTEQISLLLKTGLPNPSDGVYRLTTSELDLGQLDMIAVGGPGQDRRLEAVISRII